MDDLKGAIRDKYGKLALRAKDGAGCCGPACCDPVSKDLYSAADAAALPPEALRASLGSGNPVARAELRPGETVLDLGSGGGIDVLLSARRVGPTGKATGLDLTDEMLALARENQAKAGVANAEFLKGDLERIPLPDASVDVILSNCVLNLAADKDRAFREAFRVLRPGGRFAVSDIVATAPVPPEVRRDLELRLGCVAGALEESEFRAKLEAAGFADVRVEVSRRHEGGFASALVRARKAP
jgi:SAM-dependent methyltransferase